MVKHVNESEFKEAIGNGVVVVDFSATWCGPCKMLAPVYEELAEEMADKAAFLKVDIDESPEVSRQYAVFSVPTVMVFKDGAKKDMTVGFQPKEALVKLVEKHL